MNKRAAAWGVAALMALTLFIAGCGQRGALPVQETGLPNPVRETGGASAFEPLGLYIDAPSGSTGIVYSVIENRLAQVTFTLEDSVYAYRAAYSEDDISGVYAVFDAEESTIDAAGDDWEATIVIRLIDGGTRGALASWRYGEASFTLYTPDPTDANDMGILSVIMASSAYPDYMQG